jgi:endonuclease/exonuclease/phosphatase family metal-dependent hydrolase
MTKPTCTVVVWNAEWRTLSRQADTIRNHLWHHKPDIVCLTESHVSFPPAGFTISSEENYGYPLKPLRRKVILWSRSPWIDTDSSGSSELPPGRFVSGRTSTAIGELTVAGVCIPWPDAHVSSGRKDRSRWEDHLTYLKGLGPVIDKLPHQCVVAGDYNQYIPRRKAPLNVYQALEQALLSRLGIATDAASLGGAGLIDHLAHSDGLRISEVEALPNILPDGRRISDHVGVKIVLVSA